MTTPPTLNPPPQVRLGVYIATAVGSAVVAYLVAKGVIGDAEVTLWVALSGLANGLAAVNTTGRVLRDPRPDRGDFTFVEALVVIALVVVILWLVGGLPGAR